jgi:dipeptidyl aminopeptidase/acylaminoacyl peptidase
VVDGGVSSTLDAAVDGGGSGADARDLALARAIVFAGALDGQSEPDLYWVAEDGMRVVRLTTTAGAEQFPSWSPDHTRIAFVRDAQLYVLDVDSGVERLVAEHVGRTRALSGAAWSPDGARLVYPYPRDAYLVDLGSDGVIDESYDTTLHFVNADGTNDVAYNEPPEQSLPPGMGTLGEPAWSSTDLIAFTVADDCPDCAGGWHYSFGPSGGGELHDIEPTDLAAYPLSPRHDLDWSPDARYWVFTSLAILPGELSGVIPPRVATRSVDDPDDIRALTSAGAWYPRYAPDGASIAFLRADGLYVMNADGTSQHSILSAASVRSLDW